MTTTHTKPFILVVDDEPDKTLSDVELGFFDSIDRVSFGVQHPQDVEFTDVEKADLVLVDYCLDDWPERDAQECIGLKPITGMGLAGILRDHADRSKTDRLTAFALHSAHLDDMRGRLPAVSVPHVLARLNNLEWAFPKTEPRRYDQMVILAEAVRRLPRKWPEAEEESASELKTLLGLDEEVSWSERCWREVHECLPPIHDLRDGGHRVLPIRWLLHQIMPYPTFLWADHWAAARLRIPVEEFLAVLDEKSELSQELKAMRYLGVLSGFLGNRWWRGALEHYVWKLAGRGAGDAETLRAALRDRTGRELRFTESNSPVVCLDQEFKPSSVFVSAGNSVRLKPDHWPAFADAAWMAIDTVQGDPRLASMVDPLDQGRIELTDE